MSLIEMFVATAKKHASRMAIIDKATGHRVTYRAALLRSLILARKMDRFDPGMVGVMIPTSAGAILSVVAAVMSGRTPVMINFSTGAEQNCRLAQRRLAFRTIITSRALLEKLRCPKIEGMVFIEDLAAEVGRIDALRGVFRASRSVESICRSIHTPDLDDNVVILFTSGSEHDPKAVPLTHRNLIANMDGMHEILQYGEEDTILGNLPLFHVFGLNTNLWLPLVNAMTVVTFPNPLEFRAISTAVREEKVTMVVGTPTFLAGYLQKSEPGDFSAVRLLVTGADRCPESLHKGFREKHNVALLEGYGTTETSPVISINPPERNKPGSVGRVLPNLEVRVEHYETGVECQRGEIGKVLVKGGSVMRAYFDDFEATSMRLRNGWYDTGDMGYLDEDRYLWHVGRLGRFLKVGGEMVSLVQVEDALLRLVPAGVQCAAVEVPDALRGSKIVAVVTEKVNERDMLAKLSNDLPRIALPRYFVVVPDIPKMPSGKIDYRALTETVRDAAPAAATAGRSMA